MRAVIVRRKTMGEDTLLLSNLRVTLLATGREVSKKLQRQLADNFRDIESMGNIGATRVLRANEAGDVDLGIPDWLLIELHVGGCIHVSCDDVDEKKLALVARIVAHFADLFLRLRASKQSEFYASFEEKVPARSLERIIDAAIDHEFKGSLRHAFPSGGVAEGIKIITSLGIAVTIESDGLMRTETGVYKVLLSEFRHENKVIDYFESVMEEVKGILSVK